ncbi:LapA family protein [Mucilaginibacter sp.]
MRIKTILIILITVMLTVVLMQNTESVTFSFLWATFRMSKLVMMTAVAIVAFILGVLVGRPSRVKKLGGTFIEGEHQREDPDTLSDEDKEYIN